MGQAATLVEKEIGDSGYAEVFDNLKGVDMQVLIVCALEEPIYQNIPTMSAIPGRKLKTSTVQSAERRLVQRGLISLTGQNGIREVLDPGFALWLMRQAEGVEWQPTKPRGAPRKGQAVAGGSLFQQPEYKRNLHRRHPPPPRFRCVRQSMRDAGFESATSWL